jgi:diamine N-acetyltransferase
MTAPEMLVRRGEPSDADSLAAFAARTFVAAFGPDNRPSDLAEYVESTYSPDEQRRELSDPSYVTLLAEMDGRLAGYAQLRSGNEPPACVTGDAAVELKRFYVDAPWHGRGVAQRLMRETIDAARAMGGKTIWLGVWERNPRGIAFYQKSGFVDAGTTVFHVGSDRQTDRVMVRKVHMDEQPTCGKGLAEHSALPATVAKLLDALADNLDRHVPTLDLSDEHSRRERDAYVSLASAHRAAATELGRIAREMAGYRALPMGRHDPRALGDPELMRAFERFVRREEELLSLLRAGVERDRGMMQAMGGDAGIAQNA